MKCSMYHKYVICALFIWEIQVSFESVSHHENPWFLMHSFSLTVIILPCADFFPYYSR